MTQTNNYIGVDIAKRQLDYSFGKGKEEGREAYTDEGMEKLIACCRRHPGIRVVCEATGGYEQRLLKALAREGIRVCLVSPSKVRHFAKADGLLAKTDPIDARLLCRFAEKMDPRDYVQPAEHLEQLRELVSYRHHLVERLSELASLREHAGETVLALLAKESEQLKKLKKETEDKMAGIEQQNQELGSKIERMQQVKGVGPVVARTICALVPELGQIEDKTAASLIGTAPHPNQSGPNEKRRKVRGGRKGARDVLYMAVVSAIRFNPILKCFYQRLKGKGKHGHVCIVAVMRKLICLLNKICADPHFSIA